MPIADWIWRNSKVGIDSNCDEAGKNEPDCRAVGRSENTEGQIKPDQNKQGRKNFLTASFLNPFIQLAA